MFASENNESVRRNESTSVPLPRPAVPTLNKGIISYKTSDAHVLLLQNTNKATNFFGSFRINLKGAILIPIRSIIRFVC